DAGSVVPGKFHLILGMAALVDPLLEEGLQVAASSDFDGPFEIDRLHHLMTISRDILCHTAPEVMIAQQVAQHVQDQRALLVQVMVKQVNRLLIYVGDNGTPVLFTILSEVAPGILVHAITKLVGTLVVLMKQRIEVGGKAL